MPLKPYPSTYALIFGVLEPLGLFAGAAFALLFPNGFHQAFLGHGWLGDAIKRHEAQAGHKSLLVAAGFGSCEFVGRLSILEADLSLQQAC